MTELNYEASIKRLEEIVSLLEGGQLPLEESIRLFEEGTALSGRCYALLKNAEQKITNINQIKETEE